MGSNGNYTPEQFPRQTLLYLRTLQRRSSPNCIPQIPHRRWNRRWNGRHDEDLTKENPFRRPESMVAHKSAMGYVGPARFPSARIVTSPSSEVPHETVVHLI